MEEQNINTLRPDQPQPEPQQAEPQPEQEPVVESQPQEQPEQPVETEFNPDALEIETRNNDIDSSVDNDYGDDVDEDEVKTISKIVSKQTAGATKKMQEFQDKLEVDNFIQERPEFAKYKKGILKYLQHPVYSKIPVKNIANIVAGEDLIKIGAAKERQAQQKVAASKQTGTAVRETANINQTVDWKKATKGDIEAQRRKVLGHRV